MSNLNNDRIKECGKISAMAKAVPRVSESTYRRLTAMDATVEDYERETKLSEQKKEEQRNEASGRSTASEVLGIGEDGIEF